MRTRARGRRHLRGACQHWDAVALWARERRERLHRDLLVGVADGGFGQRSVLRRRGCGRTGRGSCGRVRSLRARSASRSRLSPAWAGPRERRRRSRATASSLRRRGVSSARWNRAHTRDGRARAARAHRRPSIPRLRRTAWVPSSRCPGSVRYAAATSVLSALNASGRRGAGHRGRRSAGAPCGPARAGPGAAPPRDRRRSRGPDLEAAGMPSRHGMSASANRASRRRSSSVQHLSGDLLVAARGDQSLGVAQRQCRDRRGRVHSRRGRPRAAAEDVQVGHVVASAVSSTTDVAGSSPIRAVPRRCHPVSRSRGATYTLVAPAASSDSVARASCQRNSRSLSSEHR